MGISSQLRQQVQDHDLPATATAPASTFSFWSKKSKEASIEGMDLAKKMGSVDIKAKPKKQLCLCAPTNHAGSFKCRLHRSCASQKSSLPEAKILGGNHESLKSNGKTRLSRFGRAAAGDDGSVEYNGQPLDPYQDSTKLPQ